jgi:hypothetical protein
MTMTTKKLCTSISVGLGRSTDQSQNLKTKTRQDKAVKHQAVKHQETPSTSTALLGYFQTNTKSITGIGIWQANSISNVPKTSLSMFCFCFVCLAFCFVLGFSCPVL